VPTSPPQRLAPIRNLRIVRGDALTPPQRLLAELQVGDEQVELILKSREEIKRILDGDDDRLLVVVGPCSIHDPEAALDYAERLREKSAELPIIVVSGSLTRGVGVPELLRAATELKGVTSLAKPFKLSELLQTVRERFTDAATRAKPAA